MMNGMRFQSQVPMIKHGTQQGVIDVEKYRDRDWLYKHYIILQESTTFIAQEAGCAHSTIRNWLHGFNIPVRARGEGIFLARRNYLDLSDKLSDLLEGTSISIRSL